MPVSRHPRVARAGTPVVPRENRPTAVLPFIQFVRMDQAVRAGQLARDSSSTGPGRLDCAGQMPALAGLVRTPVGRIDPADL
ncbi:hypothetical protein DIE22_32640 [Burkholderia sp. Bp9142]|nr:hypothetical protein DIE22_32640 [Burkholderia sp. Bp9142]RQR49827.1 hypothetical protein DIE21_19275 [Burkholderia sp. Bp9140]